MNAFRPHRPAPSPEPPVPADSRRPVVVASDSAALALAAANPAARIEIFEPDWDAVDRARVRIALGGLAQRVGVHHRLAFACPLVPIALAGARTLAVIVVPS
jgi:hypothetical protein